MRGERSLDHPLSISPLRLGWPPPFRPPSIQGLDANSVQLRHPLRFILGQWGGSTPVPQPGDRPQLQFKGSMRRMKDIPSGYGNTATG